MQEIEIKGSVMQIQHFSVNDGDGIRSTVFLAGCPLRCKWCANPEGMHMTNKVAYYEKNCIACGKCTLACPASIGISLNSVENRSRCTGCGLCVDTCQAGARKNMVTHMTAEEVVQKIEPYLMFARSSGGGVTFSGGEPTMQNEFLHLTANMLYDKGVSLAIETSGYFDYGSIEETLKMFDLIFCDIKHMDSAIHKYYTGVSNHLILQNIALFAKLPAEKVIRIPLISGMNANVENITKTAKYVKKYLPDARIELLPYHEYGKVKYEAIGKEFCSEGFFVPDNDLINDLKSIIRQEGIEIVDFK